MARDIPRSEVDRTAADLRARGLVVWCLSRAMVTRLAVADGIEGWLARGGFDPRSASLAWVQWTGGSDRQTLVVVGARAMPACLQCEVEGAILCTRCGVCMGTCCRCPRGSA